MTSENRSGHCLCGAVSFTARIDDPGIQACHCRQCQRWTGGGPLMSLRVRALKLSGDAAIAYHRASEWGERAFCKTCGSTLFWRMQERPIAYMAVGLFDDQSGLHMAQEVFSDCRAAWMHPYDGAEQSTEAQEFAKLDAYLMDQAP